MSSYKPIKLAYETHDPEGGADNTLAPIIFLHGVLASKEAWKDMPQKVSNETKRKVYNVDIRNHGDTEWTDDFDFHLMKKDTLHFMETMKCQKAIFITHSLGARIAIHLALENSEKVEKIVVEEMMVRKPAAHLLGFAAAFTTLGPKAVHKIPKGTDEDEATRIVLKSVCAALPAESVEKNKLLEMDITSVGLKKTEDGGYAFKTNMDVIAKTVKNAANVLIEPEGVYEGPALFIYGKASSYGVDKEIDHIKEHFPKAEFLGIDDALHCVHHDKPKEFLDAVLKFLLK